MVSARRSCAGISGNGERAGKAACATLGWLFAVSAFATALEADDRQEARMTTVAGRVTGAGQVAEIVRTERLEEVQAVADALGGVTVAWMEGANVYATRRETGGGAWDSAVRIGPEPTTPVQEAFGLRMAVDASGTVFAAWTQDTVTGRHVFVARRAAGQATWTTARRVTRADKALQAGVYDPVLRVAPNGDATVIWSEIVDASPRAVRGLLVSMAPQSRRALHAARFDAASARWSEAMPVDRRRTGYGFGVTAPSAAVMDGEGNVTAVWNDQVVDRPFLLAARIRNELKTSRFDVRAGHWEKPRVLARCANEAPCSPRLGIAADSTVWVAWSEATRPPIDQDVFVAHRPGGVGRWSGPRQLTDCWQDDCGDDPVDLDIAPSGSVAVLWARARMAGALRDPQGGWHRLPVTPWPARVWWQQGRAQLSVLGGADFDAAGGWNQARALAHYVAASGVPDSRGWQAGAPAPITLPEGFVPEDGWRMRALRVDGIQAVVSAGRFGPPRAERRERRDGRFQVVLDRYDPAAARWLAPVVLDDVEMPSNALLGPDPSGVIPLQTATRAAVILWWHEDAGGLVLKSADYRF